MEMKSRLYLVKGLPCSGKSTVSKMIADSLEKQGRKVIFIDEGTGNHPADYEFHSYVKEEELQELNTDEQDKVRKAAYKKENGYVVPLSLFEGELFEWLLQRKIYDFLDWKIERPVMLDKWREFVAGAKDETIYVFNCCFLQNLMCETMMRFGFDLETSLEYIKEIKERIRSLHPKVVYLKNDEISESIQRTVDERGMEWLNSVIDYHVNGVYGKRLGMQGFEGYISCLQERQKRELEILKQLEMEHILIDNGQKDWNHAYNEIKDFL
ncbi:hypothetical protein lbkm_4099 [Lachnospiraceae bacterium KM106-2]|nr:hypothetical protein lbkm_4099 [Lachnospiraceae bacterium KM106-2]